MKHQNIFGQPLEACGHQPTTGYYRNGCCQSDDDDAGVHSVCAIMTAEFLQFTREKGNDLSTPQPVFGFPGLQAGDKWCLCASRWMEAHLAGVAPPILPKATHIKTLDYIERKTLIQHAITNKNGSEHNE